MAESEQIKAETIDAEETPDGSLLHTAIAIMIILGVYAILAVVL